MLSPWPHVRHRVAPNQETKVCNEKITTRAFIPAMIRHSSRGGTLHSIHNEEGRWMLPRV